MSEENAAANSNPGDGAGEGTEPAANNAQAPVTTPSAQSQEQATEVPEGYVEQARLDGAMRALSAKDTELKTLQAQIEQMKADATQAASAWGAKEAELVTQQTQLGETIQTLTGEKKDAADALTNAQAELVKYEALKDYPQLLPLAETLPLLPDVETMKQHLELVAKSVDEIAGTKAQEITAGVTPGATVPSAAGAQQPAPYTTHQDWVEALNKAAGTDDFNSLSQQFMKYHDDQQQTEG